MLRKTATEPTSRIVYLWGLSDGGDGAELTSCSRVNVGGDPVPLSCPLIVLGSAMPPPPNLNDTHSMRRRDYRRMRQDNATTAGHAPTGFSPDRAAEACPPRPIL
jgi:hypothetical protein